MHGRWKERSIIKVCCAPIKAQCQNRMPASWPRMRMVFKIIGRFKITVFRYWTPQNWIQLLLGLSLFITKAIAILLHKSAKTLNKSLIDHLIPPSRSQWEAAEWASSVSYRLTHKRWEKIDRTWWKIMKALTLTHIL